MPHGPLEGENRQVKWKVCPQWVGITRYRPVVHYRITGICGLRRVARQCAPITMTTRIGLRPNNGADRKAPVDSGSR